MNGSMPRTATAKHNISVGRCALFLLIILMLAACFGCGAPEDENTPDITLDYLAGEYTTQLVHDGAEQLLGSVELSKNENGDLNLILHPKELVQDASQPGGYRVDSFALNRTFVIPEQAYITYQAPDADSPEILSPADFYTSITEEYEAAGLSFEEYGDHRLYDVYALDEQVLLIMYHPL